MERKSTIHGLIRLIKLHISQTRCELREKSTGQKSKYMKFPTKNLIKVNCLGIGVLKKIRFENFSHLYETITRVDKIVIILEMVMFTKKQNWTKIIVHEILYEKVYISRLSRNTSFGENHLENFSHLQKTITGIDKIVIILQTVMFTEKLYWTKIKVHEIPYEKDYITQMSQYNSIGENQLENLSLVWNDNVGR